MFFTLLIVTFLIALAVSFGVVRLFDRPIASILQRIVAEELSGAWHRYVKFAAYVVGISAGVRIRELERYISAPGKDDEILVLNAERWTLEVYPKWRERRERRGARLTRRAREESPPGETLMIGPPAHPARDDKAARSPTSVWHGDAPARERRPLVGTAARSAANGTELEQWGGPYSNGYFSRGSGAGAGHPAGWRYVVRPPSAGCADQRSAFQAVPAILRVVEYC